MQIRCQKMRALNSNIHNFLVLLRVCMVFFYSTRAELWLGHGQLDLDFSCKTLKMLFGPIYLLWVQATCFVIHYLYTFYSDLSNMFERNSFLQLFKNYVFSMNNKKKIIPSKKRIIRRMNNQFIDVGKLLLNWNLYICCDWAI